ncbi:MAG: hypothetical protein M3Y67_03345 [Pseudomonadota bacterium]|nr:hypothetical protein [Pseudomonadota bacterium]
MPIPWLLVLKSVPWGDVIGNAPKVADGAKKLWQAAAGKPPAAAASGAAEALGAEPQGVAIATLQAQLKAVEATIAELQGRMLASSQLIDALAGQNTQLIERVEAHRLAVRWLTAAVAITAVVAAVGCAAAFFFH